MNPFRAALRYYRARSSWLGDGGQPVSTLQATTRSSTCLNCPRHDTSSPLWEAITAAASSELRTQIELKAEMHLDLPGEHPHICDVCGCYLPLLVWMPDARVAELMAAETAAVRASYPSACWKLRCVTTTPAP